MVVGWLILRQGPAMKPSLSVNKCFYPTRACWGYQYVPHLTTRLSVKLFPVGFISCTHNVSALIFLQSYEIRELSKFSFFQNVYGEWFLSIILARACVSRWGLVPACSGAIHTCPATNHHCTFSCDMQRAFPFSEETESQAFSVCWLSH